MIKVIELFAGVGAQRQALKQAGIEHEVVAISEIDKYAEKAYELLHGETKNLGDIRKIKELPNADLWTYSFPCTDISLSGQMKGFDQGSGTNSSLLWEVQRLLGKANERGSLPRYLLMENVKNIVSKRFMPKFKEWLDYLEGLGYKNFWKVLNAKDYGVPQNRERCFMVSIRDADAAFEFPGKIPLERKLRDCLEDQVDGRYFLSDKVITCFSSMKNRNGLIRGLRFRPRGANDDYAWTITTCPGSRATDNFAIVPVKEALKDLPEGVEFHSGEDDMILLPQATKAGYAIAKKGDGVYINRVQWKRGVVQKSMIPTLKTTCADVGVVVGDQNELITLRRLTPRECWRLMGWRDEDFDKVWDKGISNTQLYKMAGNSIVVNCLKAIFDCLMHYNSPHNKD